MDNLELLSYLKEKQNQYELEGSIATLELLIEDVLKEVAEEEFIADKRHLATNIN